MDSKKRSFIMQVMAWALAAPLALLGIRTFAQMPGQQNPQNQLPYLRRRRTSERPFSG